MDAAFRAVQRYVSARVPDARVLTDEGGPPLEARRSGDDPPRLSPAPLLEGHAMRAVRVEGDPAAGFASFLDGVQHSRVLGYPEGLPVVAATVAAVVRVRANRKLHSWNPSPLVQRALFAPCAYLSARYCEALRDGAARQDMEVVDSTAAAREEDRPSPHPTALIDRALSLVMDRREALETQLAERWCSLQQGPIFIDGGIQQSGRVATAGCAVGVTKSHRTLYADTSTLRVVLALKRGQRSNVFRVAASRRTPVASWYLRLRDPAGRDPMWGLVRVEAADRSGDGERREDLAARAELISRWILAEATPLALPDGRWDKMVYGIRDCEEFLRAVC